MLLAAIAVVALAWALSLSGAGLALPGLGASLPNLCVWRRLSGIDCPGCGLTRSFVALAHGNLAQAWHYNPAGLLWFAAVVWQIPYRTWQLCLLSQGRELTVQPRVTISVALVLAVACVVQWGVKFCIR
jgi:hypothetical protein